MRSTFQQKRAWMEDLVRVSCAHLLKLVAQGLAGSITDPKTVSGEDVYFIFAHGLLLALDVFRANEVEAFRHYEEFFSDSMSPWSNYLLNYKYDKSTFPGVVVKSLREAAAPGWNGLLLELRKTTNAPAHIPHLIAVWLAFGLGLEFDEEKKRKEYESLLAHLCSWELCKYHLSPAEQVLKTCKGCGVEHYCSSECQLNDWKKGGHKAACRRLKG